MKDTSKVALFDVDGTLADWDGKMREDLQKLCSPGETIPEDMHDESLPWLKARMKLIKNQPGWWESLPIFPLGWHIHELCVSLGFQVHILTKGPLTQHGAWSEKAAWCKHTMPNTPFTVTMDKSLVYGRVLVDDWPEYVEPWLRNRPRGLVIMPAHPWNKDFKHEQVIRYDGTNRAVVHLALEAAYNR